MKSPIIFVFMLLMITSMAWGQDSSSSAKMDTMLAVQKMSLEMQRDIFDEIVKGREPLAGKSYGIEINPAYFAVSLLSAQVVLSGGVSLFDIDRRAEVAFPFLITQPIGDINDNNYFQWRQDVMYRRFLGKHQKGFYLAGGLRYNHIKGVERINYWDSFEDNIIKIDKLGVLFGIGYRYFSSQSGLYWGTSFSMGTYVTSDDRDIEGIGIFSSDLILDMELLKFGYTF